MNRYLFFIATLYHYDVAGNLIAETKADGTPLRDIVYLNGERVAMKLFGSQAGWYYFVNDHLGTPQKIINEAGQVVWSGAYLPFGKAWAYPATITNNFRFPGQYYDAETGLHYNWHRYYDPETGRYITADPIGLAGGLNLFAYAVGSPINLIDPNGRNPLLIIWGIIEAALSAYDVYTTAKTVADPDASLSEKGTAIGLFVIGMVAPGGGYSTGAKACEKAANSMTRVGQWMSKDEYLKFLDDGIIPRSNVLTKGPEGYMKQAAKGDYYVEFNIDSSLLKVKNEGPRWSLIKSKNRMYQKLAKQKGEVLPELIDTNIEHKTTKFKY